MQYLRIRAWSSVSALVALEGLKPQCLCDTTEETVSHKPPFSCYLTPAAVLSADYTKVVCSVDFFFSSCNFLCIREHTLVAKLNPLNL